jgi:hypothetical protein
MMRLPEFVLTPMPRTLSQAKLSTSYEISLKQYDSLPGFKNYDIG